MLSVIAFRGPLGGRAIPLVRLRVFTSKAHLFRRLNAVRNRPNSFKILRDLRSSNYSTIRTSSNESRSRPSCRERSRRSRIFTLTGSASVEATAMRGTRGREKVSQVAGAAYPTVPAVLGRNVDGAV